MKKACFKLCAFSLFYEQQNFYNPTEMRFYCCLVRENVYAFSWKFAFNLRNTHYCFTTAMRTIDSAEYRVLHTVLQDIC